MPLAVPETFEEVAPSSVERQCACEACKFARFEGSKLRNAVVHGYAHSPRGGWKPKSIRNDPDNWYLGVELETDNFSRSRTAGVSYAKVNNNVAADMRRPKNLWVPKRDGSVSGPEFASHPATLAYWRKHSRDLSDMFKMLVHAGYRSHDNDRCGMHINISRSAFENVGHLYRFLTLINVNPTWTIKMSQRTASSARQWAKLELQDSADRRSTCEVMAGARRRSIFQTPATSRRVPDSTPITDWGQALDRYTALNAPYGQPRFEFRLPRGTLRLDRFFKNLEWTHAMVEFTRDSKVTTSRPANFMKWAEENKSAYPNLVAYLIEKF